MIKKDFLKSSLIYTISSALSTAASFLLLPFYTNTNLLSISDFGALSLYIGLSLLVQVIAGLGLDFYIGTAYHQIKDNPLELKKHIASLNGFLIFSGLAITCLFAAVGKFIIEYYISNPNPDSYRYLMMSVLTGVFYAHFRFYANLLIHTGKPARYFWTNFLNFFTTILFSVGILKMYPNSLEGPLWGRVLSNFSIFLISFYEITAAYGITIDRKYVKPVWQFCFPLIITSVFQWVLSYSDRYIIKPLLFNKEVAIFDFAVKCTLLIGFLLDGLVGAMAPRIYHLLRDPENPENIKEINKYYSSFNLVMLILIPLNILFIPILLPFFISSDKYLVSFCYFGIISAGFVTRSIQNLFIYPLYFFRKTLFYIPINGISAIGQVALGYLLIKYFKLYGAAVTLNIVKIIMIILYWYFCKDLVSKSLNMKKMIILPVVSFFILCLPEFFIRSYGPVMHIIHFAEFCVIAGITYLVYKTEATELFKWSMTFVNSKISKTS